MTIQHLVQAIEDDIFELAGPNMTQAQLNGLEKDLLEIGRLYDRVLAKAHRFSKQKPKRRSAPLVSAEGLWTINPTI